MGGLVSSYALVSGGCSLICKLCQLKERLSGLEKRVENSQNYFFPVNTIRKERDHNYSAINFKGTFCHHD